jgi:hypothetical protein
VKDLDLAEARIAELEALLRRSYAELRRRRCVDSEGDGRIETDIDAALSTERDGV